MGLRPTSKRRSAGAFVDSAAFGAFLLDLYRMAREVPLAQFQGQALERLCLCLPFDGAWWGMARLDRELHSSYPFRMAPGFTEEWNRIRDHDLLADAVMRAPGVTVRFAPRDIAADISFAAFFGR